MLLNFKAKNYKSFSEELVFSMEPASRQKGLDYSLLKKKINNKNYTALCSAVIYGPNATGKTNIIGAIETLKAIILKGSILNQNVNLSPNIASSRLEYIPNFKTPGKSTDFSISFITDNLFIEYALSIDLGVFLEENYPRKILNESLSINSKIDFLRDSVNNTFEGHLPKNIASNNQNLTTATQNTLLQLAKNSLSQTEIFLTNGFKTIYSLNLCEQILKWFNNKLHTIYRSNDARCCPIISDSDCILVDKSISEAAKHFGITSNDLGYKVLEEGKSPELVSIFDEKKIIRAELFESYGTIRFINEFPLILNTLKNGGTLIMDEFDASIHPMALMDIINIFHNDEINVNKAQLIFNTHNPIFLNSTLFRRDEIKFVDRDETTQMSIHYSLSDFKKSAGVRTGEDYLKNYFISKYGTIKNIEFSDIVKNCLTQSLDTEKNQAK